MFYKKKLFFIIYFFIILNITYAENYVNKKLLEYRANFQDYDFFTKKSYLIGNAILIYDKTIFIKAEYIEINWKQNFLYAKSKIDIDEKKKQTVIFKKNKIYECDSLFFDMKNKILSFNNLIKDNSKESSISSNINVVDHSLSTNNTFYTTDNYYHNNNKIIPDFYLKANFIKKIQNKFFLVGPLSIFLYQVPMPILIPFFLIPISYNIDYTKSIKFLMPTLRIGNNKELVIKNLGFYMPISNNINSKISLSIYTKKGYKINSLINYNLKSLNSGFIILKKKKILNKYNYQFLWNHNLKNYNKKFNNLSTFFYNKIDFKKNNIKNSINTFSLLTFKKRFTKIPLKLLINGSIKNFTNNIFDIHLPKIKLNIKKYKVFKYFNINYMTNYDNNIITNKIGFFNEKSFLTKKISLNTMIFFNKKINIKPNINYNNDFFYAKKNNKNFIYNKKNYIFFIDFIFKKKYNINSVPHLLNFNIRYLYNRYSKIIKNNYYYNNIHNSKSIYDDYHSISFIYNNKYKNTKFIKKLILFKYFNIKTIYNNKNNFFSLDKINFKAKGNIYNNINYKINGMIDNYKSYKNYLFNNNFYLKFLFFSVSYKSIFKNLFIDDQYFIINKIRYENFFFNKKKYAINPNQWKINYNIIYTYNNNISLNNNHYHNKFLFKFFGKILFTPYWLVNFDIDYDFIKNKINNSIFKISRDLRSFETRLILNTSLNGNKSWSFYFGLKYPIVKDIKISNYEN